MLRSVNIAKSVKMYANKSEGVVTTTTRVYTISAITIRIGLTRKRTGCAVIINLSTQTSLVKALRPRQPLSQAGAVCALPQVAVYLLF